MHSGCSAVTCGCPPTSHLQTTVDCHSLGRSSSCLALSRSSQPHSSPGLSCLKLAMTSDVASLFTSLVFHWLTTFSVRQSSHAFYGCIDIDMLQSVCPSGPVNALLAHVLAMIDVASWRLLVKVGVGIV